MSLPSRSACQQSKAPPRPAKQQQQSEPDTEENGWRVEWHGMPEFKSKDKKPFRTIKMHFKCQEAVDSFSELLGQKITDKTLSLWHPTKVLIHRFHLRYSSDK